MEKSLFQIENEFAELANQLIENEGELTPELEKSLRITQQELKHKAGGYSKVIKQINAEVSIIDAEIKRLQSLKKTRKNAIDRLKNSLTNAMQTFDIASLETPLTKITFRKSKSVEYEDVEKLPAECIIIEKKVSKTALKSLLEQGEKIEGAKIVENKSIQIK